MTNLSIVIEKWNEEEEEEEKDFYNRIFAKDYSPPCKWFELNGNSHSIEIWENNEHEGNSGDAQSLKKQRTRKFPPVSDTRVYFSFGEGEEVARDKTVELPECSKGRRPALLHWDVILNGRTRLLLFRELSSNEI